MDITYLLTINDILQNHYRGRAKVVKAEAKEDTFEHATDTNNAKRIKEEWKVN